jgi:iron complex outermembrane receptor protein
VHEADAMWAESFADRLTFELTYYSHEIDKGIQARDIQALLNACLAAGGTDATLCSPFTRQTSGNLNPPNNFLDNLGSIKTDGVDFKVDWKGKEMSWGALSAGLQMTHTNKFEAIDTDGIVSQRAVGIEVSDSAIPKNQINMQIGWAKGNWDVALLTRYIDSVDEICGNALTTNVPGCNNNEVFHELKATTYNDVALSWNKAFSLDGLKLGLNVNNIFGEDAPVCYTCSLNGYDAGTYDLPGTFWAVTLKYGF